jgi:hypothetical protein
MLKQLFAIAPAVLVLTGAAGAQILVCEDFSYPDGSLVPNGGWATHSGTAGDLQVVGGAALVQHGAPSEDAHVSFVPVPGIVYYSFDFSVNDPGAPIPGSDNEYFAHFYTNSTTFSARMDVVPATGGGDYSVGIATYASTAESIWPVDLTYGAKYRVVVSFDQDLAIAELWIDPLVETDPSILGSDQSDPGDVLNGFALRQSDSNLNEGILVDNLVVARSFAEALGACTVGTQTARFSVSPNPGVLSPGVQPNVGTTWNPTVTVAGSVSDLLLVAFTPVDIPTSFGSLLCLPSSSPLIVAAPVPGAPFAIPIPNNPMFVGAAVCTQGLGIDATVTVSMTNALDLVIGG